MAKIKVRILNKADYCGMPEEYPFDVEVDEEFVARGCYGGLAGIPGKVLILNGADKDCFDDDYPYAFAIGEECEIMEE